MKCRNCKTKYESMGGGMGEADSPRSYLFTALFFLVLGAVFVFLFTPCTAISVFAAIVCLVYVPMAMFEQNYKNKAYNVVCPKCGRFNKAMPWSN